MLLAVLFSTQRYVRVASVISVGTALLELGRWSFWLVLILLFRRPVCLEILDHLNVLRELIKIVKHLLENYLPLWTSEARVVLYFNQLFISNNNDMNLVLIKLLIFVITVIFYVSLQISENDGINDVVWLISGKQLMTTRKGLRKNRYLRQLQKK